MGQYLHEIGQTPLLNAVQERELAQAIEAGRDARSRLDAGETGVALKRAVREAARARDHFIRANLRLVVNLARRYPLPSGMELLDLVQEGNLGLEHAVEKFDWRKGFKFSTYATFWIRQAIGRALDSKGSLVRLPGERSAELRSALRNVSGEGGDLSPAMSELHRLSTPTSLDRSVGEDGEQELVDLLPHDVAGPEALVLEQLHEEAIRGLLDRLDSRAKLAVEHRFGLVDGERRSFREVGEAIGVTAEGARRIVKRAVDELREDVGALAA